MPTEISVDTEVPAKLKFLYSPGEIKVAWGGRGKGATWGIADALLIIMLKRPLRWLCARETMESISESTHATLATRIGALGLQDNYEVQDRRIICRRWEEGQAQAGDPLAGRYGFSFAGLHNNAEGLKSYESYDGCWLAEAQALTKKSWLTLTPTFRKDPPFGPFGPDGMGSEIWVDFNPDLDSDFCWERFVVNPTPRMVVQKLNWRDNPFFPKKLRDEMNEMRLEDPDSCDHVYEGIPRSNVKGAVFGDEMRRMDLDGRIKSVPYNPARPVYTFWDVGMDTTSIWFMQDDSLEIRLIDYYENKGKGMDHYVRELNHRGYVYACHWLPWDVGVQAAPEGMGQGQSLEFILRKLMPNCEVRSSPRWNTTQIAINAGRLLFPRVVIDANHCEDGIRGLRRFQWGEPPKSGATTRQPLHDWASHPASAFMYLTNFAAKKPVPQMRQEQRIQRREYSPFG